MDLGERRRERARAAITVGLLLIAAWSIALDKGETMAGAIIGYVAHYWLPPANHLEKIK